MNWEPQHLPWKVTEPRIDGYAFPDILTPRVLDASLALPESDLSNFPQKERRAQPEARADKIQLSPVVVNTPYLPCKTGKIAGVRENGRMPKEEYPHTDNGIPIRGKHFFARDENPKYEDLGSNPPEGDFIERLARIKEWEEAHKPKLETLKLDDLTAEDYKKVYANNANIKIEQIELAPMTEDRWLTYRRIEGAVNVILVEAYLAGRQATEYRHLSQYPSGHDFYLQLRNQVSKKTGIGYQAVSRGLNHILKKDMIRRMRTDTVYRDAYVALGQDWNRTNLWKMDGDHVIEAREKHGKDWIKRDTLVWSWNPLMNGDRVTDEGEYADHSWPHWHRYTKEHSTFL